MRLAIGKTIHEGAIDGNAVRLRDKSAPVGEVHCFEANEARRLRPWLCHFSIVRRAHRVLALRERERPRAHVYEWHPDTTGLDSLSPAHPQLSAFEHVASHDYASYAFERKAFTNH